MRGSKPGERRGGRKVGTPNKQRSVADILAECKFDPIKRMIEIATDPETDTDTIWRVCDRLARYVHPEQRAVEHSGPGGTSITVVVRSVLDPA